jgi:hypothetical protein
MTGGKFSDDHHVNDYVPDEEPVTPTSAEDIQDDYKAIKVHITNVVDTNESANVSSPTFDIPYTVVVQAGQSDPTMAVRELVPADLLRINFTVIALDSPVIIARSIEEAQSPANTQTATPYPVGALLNPSYKLQLLGNNQLWVAATVNTSSRVLVVVERAEAA